MLPTSIACAQVVRFQTSVGDFDLVLNPTSNPALQGHVDNMLHYVLSGRYDATVINRAARYVGTPFVLQMGSYETASPAIPATADGFLPIETFDPIPGVPADYIGLSNTIGTVGLAVGSDGAGGINRNSGQSSLYINLDNNSFLDNDFTVFARIANLATVNSIMALPTVDLTLNPAFGPFSPAFTEVPTLPNGNMVFILKAFVVQNSLNPKGDYNGNGKVDSADYVAWRRSQKAGVIGAGLVGDGNQNGVVDGDDYNIWRAHFGAIAIAGTGTGQSSVPEPSTGALALPILGWWVTRRFARSRFANKKPA